MGGPGGAGSVSRNTDLALAAGYVVVSPGCRGRDNRAADGTYYGKAPAAIVDLKAAVRYVRHNAGVMPGNVNWIVTTGVSAGGALSALLGASGNSRLYDAYLKEIGAADADDAVFASADFCPIMDLDHADMAYEWMYGTVPARSGLVNQELSRQLKDAFAAYQASLKLQGRNGFGTLTADNYAAYLLKTYLIPSANKYLRGLTEEQRTAYLAKNPWLAWSDNGATFTFADYVAHVGRMKGLPAFDDFEMRQPEPNEFGNKTTDSRHFTDFSLRQATGDSSARIGDDLQTVVNLMNPMYFIGQNNRGLAGHWWIRMGTSDNHTSLTVVGNLAASLENRNKDVNAWLYWDAGHGADEDAEDFIAWIGEDHRVHDPEMRGSWAVSRQGADSLGRPPRAPSRSAAAAAARTASRSVACSPVTTARPSARSHAALPPGCAKEETGVQTATAALSDNASAWASRAAMRVMTMVCGCPRPGENGMGSRR